MTAGGRRVVLFLSATPFALLLWLLVGSASADTGMRPEPLHTTASPSPCNNGRDDDDDGKTDHPDDPGCTWTYDRTEDVMEVKTFSTIDFRPRSGVFRGQLSVSITAPRGGVADCLRRRVKLMEHRPGEDRFVGRVRTRSDGSWLIEASRDLSSAFYVLVYPRLSNAEWFDTIKCTRRISEQLPVFTSAPVLHPYCDGEAATMVGTNEADLLQGIDDPEWSDVIITFDGDDRVESLQGDDVVCSGDGDDEIDGGDGGDRLLSGEGNDSVAGGDGATVPSGSQYVHEEIVVGLGDAIWPGPGNDIVDGGPGPDYVSWSDASGGIVADLQQGFATGEGDDQLAGFEVMRGSAFNDELTGSDIRNGIYGGAGDDVISAGDGSDVVYGEDGNDELVLAAGNDQADGGFGMDVIFGDEGDDELYGDPPSEEGASDEIHGGEGNDRLTGSGGDDRLWGDEGDDRLGGVFGDDYLDGGPDVDHLNGWEGTDTCVNGETVEECEN